jgi:hypothetical protein
MSDRDKWRERWVRMFGTDEGFEAWYARQFND